MEKVTLKEALTIINGSVHPLESTFLPLFQALGCRLAADIVAPFDNPPFLRSPLDGYAVRIKDVANASDSSPAILRVVGRSYAGAPSPASVSKGEAVYILTGGAIPTGADCVVRQENTDLGTHFVRVFAPQVGKSNICPIGEDFVKGETLVRKGEIIHAAAIAVAAAAGHRNITAVPNMKAAILATGDEVVTPGRELSYGQIYDSNSPYIAARLAELNIATEGQAYCPDRADDTKELLRALLDMADVVITTGGVSVGERDLVPEAIRQIGGKILFHGVEIKPGMPALFAIVNGKPVLSLSGNPYSAAVTFELFGRAIFARLSGNDELLPKQSEGVLQNDYTMSGKTVRYVHGSIKDGRVILSQEQGNARLHAFSMSNCLAEVSPEIALLKQGDKVRVIKIR